MKFDYYGKQKKLCNTINSIYNNGTFGHAYLIESNGVSYAYDFVVSVIKFFLELPSDYDIFSYPEVNILFPINNVIKKEQIISLKNDFSFKCVYGKYMIYFITDGSCLNEASSNSLLKFLEDPDSNVIAFILAENRYQVIPTISSRCQLLSMNYEAIGFEENISEYVDFYLKLENDFDLLYSSDFSYYLDNISKLLLIGSYFYYDIFNYLLNRKKFVILNSYSDDIKNLSNKYSIYDIIKKIEIINGFISVENTNLNKDLFLDNIIISLEGVKL